MNTDSGSYGQQFFNAEELKNLFFELIPKVIEGLSAIIEHNRQIEKKLEELNQKIDQLTVKEIQSSYQIIAGISQITSPAMRERHLLNAESNLIKNIALNKEAKTADLNNTVWIARSYYGLTCIAILRDEKQDASRFLLKAFLANPRETREKLAVEVYNKFFKPRCQATYIDYERKKAVQPANDEKIRKIERKLTWRKIDRAAGFVFGLLSQNPQIAMTGQIGATKAADEIQQLRGELARIPTQFSIEREFNEAIDKNCRLLAESLMNDKTFSAYR